MQKEARSQRMMEEDKDVFISTNIEASNIMPLQTFPCPPKEPKLTVV